MDFFALLELILVGVGVGVGVEDLLGRKWLLRFKRK
mgnify:CR=1 FL=1